MRKWLPLITVSIGTFMLLVDVTIVNVALPRMSVDLHASFSSLQWTIDIYALALAALMLGIGSVADLVGRTPVYVAGLCVFALSSLGAGLAGSPMMLIVFRGVEGIGGAAMFATTTALLNETYQGRERGTAYGIWGAIAGAAAAAGPIAGGLLTQGLSWRWIFFVNLPLSVVAIALSLRTLPGGERRGGRIDVPGTLAFTVSAGAFTYALTRVSENGWTSVETLGCFALALASAVGFVLAEWRSAHPMIELSLLARGRFSGVLVAAMVLSISAFGALTYLSLWMQSVREMSPIATGLALIPLSLLSLVVSATIGRRLHDRSPRWPIAGGLALIGIGALIQAHLGAGSGWSAVLPGLVLAGIGSGFAAPTLSSAALGAVPLAQGGMASGAVNTARQLGYAIGIAGLGIVCQRRIAARLTGAPGIGDAPSAAHRLIGGQRERLLGGVSPAQRGALDHVIHGAFASGLDLTLLVAGACGIAGAVFVFVMLGARAPRTDRATAPHAA